VYRLAYNGDVVAFKMGAGKAGWHILLTEEVRRDALLTPALDIRVPLQRLQPGGPGVFHRAHIHVPYVGPTR
jgi:hypothetical protein